MISRSALSTVALLPIHALQNGAVSGRHRRQGRKPAASAAAADGKNETWADSGGAHRTDRTAVNTGSVNAGIEPPVIDRISRQARAVAFRKVQRHGHDNTRCRCLGPTPFRGWSPVLASDSSHFTLRLTARIWGAVRALLGSLGTDAWSRETSSARQGGAPRGQQKAGGGIAAASKHRRR